MESFPFFFRLEGKSCLVVGGGEGARHKASLLRKAGAQVTLLAETLHPSTAHLLESDSSIVWRAQAFSDEALTGMHLVIAAADEALNRSVAASANRQRILVNAVDMPDISDFFFPSIVERGPLTIAIGSNGSAPVMVRHLRTQLEAMLPQRMGDLGDLVQRFRDQVRAKFPQIDLRRRFWDKHLNGLAAEKVLAGQSAAADVIVGTDLDLPGTDLDLSLGEVYLVGAGPGDPDLLTFRALRLMQQADVVLYDRLVSDEVLDKVRRESELIFVGKGRNIYSIDQDNINQSLVELAKQGKRVLRLKGGDPCIFGRGGEELEYLVAHGVSFQVVPGITAASGCASYAGIPLTHRDHAQSVRFITGHRVGGELNLDWQQYVKPGQTLVFYMGLNGLEAICNKLLEYGASADLPVALIEKGTRRDQRVFCGTLADLPATVRAAGAEAPTLIIVGTVVSLHHSLAWWNTSPDPASE